MKRFFLIKFLKKVLLVFIPIYFIWFIYIELMPLYYNRPTNTRWYFIKQCLEKKREIPSTNNLFLGESRLNAALDFKQLPNSYSFASGGASPIEMYYILKKYINNYSGPDTVYFSISPRFLSETFAFFPYAVRNNLFSLNEFKEIYSRMNKSETTLAKNPRLKFILYKLNYIEYYQSDVLYNHVFAGHKENNDLIEQMVSFNGGRQHPGLKDSCSLLNYETKYEHFVPAPLLTLYLDSVFSLCKQKSIHLRYFFVPINKSSYEALKPAFINEYRSYIRSFAEKYSDFEISDTVYYYPDSFFGDESHLNSKGQLKFTEYFKQEYFNNDENYYD